MKTPYTLTSPKMPYGTEVLIAESARYGTHYLELSYLNRDDTEPTYRILFDPQDTLARWTGTPENHVSQESITAAVKQLKRNVRKQKAVAREGHKTPAYRALLPVFERVVKHYHADFTFHDALFLAHENPARFIWAVSDSGTHIYCENSTWSRGALEYLRQNKSNTLEFYFWDSTTGLTRLLPDEIGAYVTRLPYQYES